MKFAATLLVFCVGALLALGLVILYSTGMMQGEKSTQYFIKQLTWAGIGLLACLITYWLDYRIFRSMAWVLFGISVVLLVLVLIPGIGVKSGGARRWFQFAGVSFQPSEMAKLTLMMVLAWYGARYQRQMRKFGRGIVVPGLIIAPVLGLMFLEPDVGSTILLGAISAIILLVAGIRWLHFLPPVILAVAALGLFLWQDPMRSERIYSWLHLEETKNAKGLQAWEARLAFGAGGWDGLGLGNGRQKHGFVPKNHTDFIFSVIGEELGLIATLGVVVAFFTLVVCGVYISSHAGDVFGLLLGTGITFMIGLQAFINMGVVTGTLPNKGLPLPFISYGGSNLLLMLGCVGILLSIARHSAEASEEASELETSEWAPQMS